MTKIRWNSENVLAGAIASLEFVSDETEPGTYYEIWREDDGSYTVDFVTEQNYGHIGMSIAELDEAKRIAEAHAKEMT